MKTRAGYRILDHTADAALHAFGPTPAEALRQAVLGTFALIVPPEQVEPRKRWDVEASGDDPDLLLFNLLDELLYLHHTQGLLVRDAQVEGVDPQRPLRARAIVTGEPVDTDRHSLGTEIKAVTLHTIGLRPQGGAWSAQVVFDL